MTLLVYDFAIIGAGASGLVSAIAAAKEGVRVLLLEKNNRVGKKILATGNGRCNLGNDNLHLDNFVSHDLESVRLVLAQFGKKEAKNFFNDLGLPIVQEDGRWYPRTKQSASVLQVLLQELQRLNIEVMTDSPVRGITTSDKGFHISLSNSCIEAAQVLIATGGMAAPQLGCSGDGYAIAKSFGHNVISPSPALVGLKVESAYLKTLSGLRQKAEVQIPELGLTEEGEVLFTDYGLSGIPIFDLTRKIGHCQGLTLRLKLAYEAFDKGELLLYLQARLRLLGHKSVEEMLVGYIPQQLIVPILREAMIDRVKLSANLKSQDIDRLCKKIFAWDFPILGLNTWEQAQTTWGGIPLGEIKPDTMASGRQSGLYFAGELLDAHGRCGGYNLHWAFASGFLAGKASRRYRQS